jgi:hypothetical protein
MLTLLYRPTLLAGTPPRTMTIRGLEVQVHVALKWKFWEANSQAAAHTLHVCANHGLYECTGTACGRYNAPCDNGGRDFNSYRMGNATFFGTGMTVNTTKPFTVVT